MTPPVLRLTVVGTPETKGSTKAFVPKSWAAAAYRAGRAPRAIVTNDNPKAKAWQQRIADTAAEALQQGGVQPFATGGVILDAWFYLARPQRWLIPKYADVDVPHTTRPDADKLLRLVKDALSRVVWHDDAQVIDAYAHKRYCRRGEVPRAEITVRPVQWDLPQPIAHPELPSLFGEEASYAAAPRSETQDRQL